MCWAQRCRRFAVACILGMCPHALFAVCRPYARSLTLFILKRSLAVFKCGRRLRLQLKNASFIGARQSRYNRAVSRLPRPNGQKPHCRAFGLIGVARVRALLDMLDQKLFALLRACQCGFECVRRLPCEVCLGCVLLGASLLLCAVVRVLATCEALSHSGSFC